MQRQPQITIQNLRVETVALARALLVGNIGDVTYVNETGYWYEWMVSVEVDDGISAIENAPSGLHLIRIPLTDPADTFSALVTTTPGTPISLTHNFGTTQFVAVAQNLDTGKHQTISIEPSGSNDVLVDSNAPHDYYITLRRLA